MKRKPFIHQVRYDVAKGLLSYNGIRYIAIRPETIVGFQKSVERKIGKSAGNALFEGGYEGGRRSALRLKELFRLDGKETLSAMGAMGGEIGWGKFTISRFSSARKTFKVTVRNSPFAEAYGKSKRPVCHFISGVLSGISNAIFANSVAVRETRCRSRGDAICVFETI